MPANLEAAYGQRLDAQRELALMPTSLYWQPKGGTDCLASKAQSSDPGTPIGARSAQTEARLAEHLRTKEALKSRTARADGLIAERAGLSRHADQGTSACATTPACVSNRLCSAPAISR